ncbi:uncharacterized protein LOC111322501 [Stylophora pistillata]|uniref:uncharacterized protein LOC111322501 n=1 Tax=Stylophora pistillata TaxID=50429 RepID=UPI000C03CCDA|nr:uncharacterized protein LOC111322501 [Stylophora pistillata]
MKAFIGFWLFAFATADIYQWVGLPEENYKQLDKLLNDEKFTSRGLPEPLKPGLGNLLINDHGEEKEGSEEGSGEGSGVSGVSGISGESDGSGGSGKPPPVKDAIEDLVESLHAIIPALKILKKARDEKNQEYAQQLVEVIKHAEDDADIKILLGYHVMKLNERCHQLKLAFARHANQSGLLDQLGSDDLDFTKVMGQVIEEAEQQAFDVFEAFTHIAFMNGLNNYPGAKAIMAVGGLVADAACDTKLDGLVKIIGEIVEKEDKESDYDISDKFIPFLYNPRSKFCRGNFIQSLKPEKSMKARFLRLVFSYCKEVRFARFAVSTVLDKIKLYKKLVILHKVEGKRLQGMIKAVTTLMASHKVEKAFLLAGDYVVDSMRRALLVGLAVHKKMESLLSAEEKGEEKWEEKSEEKEEEKGEEKRDEKPTDDRFKKLADLVEENLDQLSDALKSTTSVN